MMDSYDCVVVGGGPAGAATAALVAQAGYATLLAERQRLPRCHVGESLMPEVRPLLQQLGVLDAVQQCGFARKVGVQFVSADGGVSQSFFFQDRDPGETSLGWNVERAAFDRLLFENAGAKGADCCDQTEAAEILLHGDAVQGVKLTTAAGEAFTVRCRVLVDATGQQALVANRLGLARPDVDLPGAAIWGYYRGARRDAGEHAAATVLLHTTDKSSWFWCVPLADDVASIGVVGKREKLVQGNHKLAAVFEDELVQCPALIERLINAELLGAFHSAAAVTYSVERRAGQGWLLVGDAGGAADPLFGSGVLLALRSGAWAAEAVIEGLRRNDLSAAQLGRWIPRFDAGVKKIRSLARMFLSPPFSCGQLVNLHPDQKARLTELLMGRLFEDGGSPTEIAESWLQFSSPHNSPGSAGPHVSQNAGRIPIE
jgi:flavin-dependent dehydrogenase